MNILYVIIAEEYEWNKVSRYLFNATVCAGNCKCRMNFWVLWNPKVHYCIVCCERIYFTYLWHFINAKEVYVYRSHPHFHADTFERNAHTNISTVDATFEFKNTHTHTHTSQRCCDSCLDSCTRST